MTEQAEPTVNIEIDPRIYMAAERTFLAWIRTGIALMGFGFVIARFSYYLKEVAANLGTENMADQAPTQSGPSLWIGVGLIAFGVLVNAISVTRHLRYIKALDRNEFRSAFGSSFAIFVALTLAIVGVSMTIYLLQIL